MSTTTTYKNVLLIGAAGDLGKHIFSSLLADSTFNVTVLSRTDSTSIFPSNVKVIKVDYSDKAALTKALAGQDVVISAVTVKGLAANLGSLLVEAALEAGVKWLIPSEFGLDTDHPLTQRLAFVASKIASADLLKKNESRIAHTFIITGGFLDWGFDNGFLGFDISNRSVTIYDEGKQPFSGTTLPSIGKAVVAVLHHPELALNKYIYIADTTFTQQQALSLFEKYTETKWTVKQVNTGELLKKAAEGSSKDNANQGGHAHVLAAVFNGQGACRFENKTSNKALGLETIPLEQIVKEAVERKKAAH